MIVPLEKPGTPEELVHFGVKGMKWGVRNKVVGSSGYKGLSKATQKNVARTRDSQRVAQKTARTIQRNKKKIAIGVAGTAAVIGGAYLAYRLHQRGSTPISSLHNTKKASDSVNEILSSIGTHKAPNIKMTTDHQKVLADLHKGANWKIDWNAIAKAGDQNEKLRLLGLDNIEKLYGKKLYID